MMRTTRTFRALAMVVVYLHLSQLMLACEHRPSEAATRRPAARVASSKRQPLPAGAPVDWALLPSPGLVGSTPFTTDVSPDGQSSVTIPLWVPPGRAGLQPELALSYSSNRGDGLLGLGWALSGASAVTRCGKTPAQDGAAVWASAATSGAFCLDGSRLVEASPNEYRTDPESYRKITYEPAPADRWVVRAPDGGRRIFEHERQPQGVSSPFAWLLSETRDAAGNAMTFTYGAEGELLQIEYARNDAAGLPATRSVRFVYEVRNNPLHHQVMGGDVATTKRLKTIEMRAPTGVTGGNGPTAVARKYELVYRASWPTPESTHHDVLEQVKECDGAAACKPPIVFSLSDARVKFKNERLIASASVSIEGVVVADLDSDGLQDLAYQTAGVWKARLQLRGAFPAGGFGGEFDLFPGGPTNFQPASPFPLALDFDGDGRSELLAPVAPAASAISYYTIYVNQLGPGWTPHFVQHPDFTQFGTSFSGRALVGDLNGDGKPDVLDADWRNVQGTSYPPADLVVYWNQSTPGNLQFSAPQPWLEQTCPQAGVIPGTALTAKCWAAGGGTTANCQQCTAGDVVRSASVPAGATQVVVSARATRPAGTRFGVNRSGTGSYGLENFVTDMNGDGLVDAVYRDGIDDSWEFRDASDNPLTPSRPAGLLSRVLRRAQMVGPNTFSPIEVGAVEDSPDYIGMSMMLEANGDGFPDLLVFGEPYWINAPFTERQELGLKRNDGLGNLGARANVLTATHSSPATHWKLDLFRVADVDLDGRDDLLTLGTNQMLSFAKWGHWQPLGTEMGVLENRFGAAPQSGEFWGDEPSLNVRVGDVTGDTLADIVLVRGNNIMMREHEGERPGLIKSVSQGRRLESFGYVPLEGGLSSYEAAASCDVGQVCVKSGMLVVKQHSVRAEDPSVTPAPATNTTTYSYSDGRIDLLGRGWLGFARVTAKDEVSGAVQEMEYGVKPADRVVCSGSTCASRYFYPFAFKPKRVSSCIDLRSQASETGRAMRVEVTASTTAGWSEGATPGTPRVHLTGTALDSTEREGVLSGGTPLACPVPLGSSLASLPALRSSRQTTLLQDGTPVSTVESSWAGDFTAGGGVPSNPPGGVHERSTTTTLYPADTTNWLLGLPRTTTVTSVEPGAAPASRTMDYEYVSGTSLLWRETRMKAVPSSTSDFELRKEYTRDVANNVFRTDWTDTANAVTRRVETDFDPAERMFPVVDRVFPQLTAPPLASQRWYERSLALLAKRDDLNAQATVWKYDSFGRLREVEDARAPKRRVTYSLVDGFLEARDALTFVTGAVTSEQVSTTRFDAFGRAIRVSSTGWRGKTVVRTASYDRLGRLTHESLPFFEGKTPEYVVHTFDKLGRETSVQNTASGDTQAVAFEGLVQRLTDARGMLTTLTHDAKGRLTDSATLDGSRQLITHYDYGPFDTLTRVADPLGRQRVLTYDALGRREALVDPDSGRTETHYNAFDEEKWTQDARGATVTTMFDGLGRKTSATLTPAGGVVAGLVSNTETFVWDTAPNGKGALQSATSMDGVVTSYGYNALSQPASQSWAIPGRGTYGFATSYDDNGRVSGHSYPSGFATAVEFDVSGHVKNVFWSSSQQSRLFHVEDVNAAGQVVAEEFGNQAVTRRTFDDAYRLTYQSTEKRAQIGSGPEVFQQLKYEYGLGSAVVARHDPTRGLSEYFEHDFANRLKRWRVEQKVNLSCRGGILEYGYDDAGNLTSRTVVGGAGTNVVNGYGPQAMLSAGVNALTSTTEGTAPATRFRYDAAGNQTDVFHHRAPSSPTDVGDKRLTWTHFNLPREVVDGITGSGTTTFRYDAGHQRVLETRGSTVRVTVGGVFEERDVGGVGQQQVRTHNVFAAGRLVAQLTQTAAFGQWSSTVTANYVHQDALGSPDAVTGGAPGSPVLVERAKYEPFGEKRNPDDVFLAATPQAHTRNVGFTGHQPDDAFGLTNMKGRLYDQRTGRFVSADPVVSAPGFGQAFNRYAYVHNDPVHFVDPSGFFGIEAVFVILFTLPLWAKIVIGALAVAGTIFGAVSSFIPLGGRSSPSPSTPSGAPTGGDAGRADDSTGKPASDAPKATGSPPPASDAAQAPAAPSSHPSHGTPVTGENQRRNLDWLAKLDRFEQRRALSEMGVPNARTVNGVELPPIEEVWRYDFENTLGAFEASTTALGLVHGSGLNRAARGVSWYFSGASNDMPWLTSSLRNKALYELGQTAVEDATYRLLPQGNSFQAVVLRGERLLDRADGSWIRAFASGSASKAIDLLSTGPTPAFRFVSYAAMAGVAGCGATMSCRQAVFDPVAEYYSYLWGPRP
ncbi:MAG: RHS repeat-associated core domain-containing protein [Myxococcota bacterium]